MTEGPPFGLEATDDQSHAPIWQIAPDAGDQDRAQIPGIVDFSLFEGEAGVAFSPRANGVCVGMQTEIRFQGLGATWITPSPPTQ